MFKLNSPEDLLCRGFSQEYILEKTGFDVGYHGTNLKNQLLGIDRKKYKIDHIKKNVGVQDWEKALNDYSKGKSKTEVLNSLGISGENIINLNYVFEKLGLKNAFASADKKRRYSKMSSGMVEKYGVDNPFKTEEGIKKAVQGRKRKAQERRNKLNQEEKNVK